MNDRRPAMRRILQHLDRRRAARPERSPGSGRGRNRHRRPGRCRRRRRIRPRTRSSSRRASGAAAAAGLVGGPVAAAEGVRQRQLPVRGKGPPVVYWPKPRRRREQARPSVAAPRSWPLRVPGPVRATMQQALRSTMMHPAPGSAGVAALGSGAKTRAGGASRGGSALAALRTGRWDAARLVTAGRRQRTEQVVGGSVCPLRPDIACRGSDHEKRQGYLLDRHGLPQRNRRTAPFDSPFPQYRKGMLATGCQRPLQVSHISVKTGLLKRAGNCRTRQEAECIPSLDG